VYDNMLFEHQRPANWCYWFYWGIMVGTLSP